MSSLVVVVVGRRGRSFDRLGYDVVGGGALNWLISGHDEFRFSLTLALRENHFATGRLKTP